MARTTLVAFLCSSALLAGCAQPTLQANVEPAAHIVADAEWTAPKRTAAEAVDARATDVIDVSRAIWEHAELALKESKSSALLADLLEADGFRVERGVSGMPTAFLAEWGSGAPVVAYLAEYDALPTLSQKAVAEVSPRLAGEPGHGCGHNLFGAGAVGAGLALKAAMEAHDLPGTVRVYGTPAEEHGIGKVFMVRDGLFDDVDACLSWHPNSENKVSLQPSKALRSFEVTFYGRSAHAAGAPWEAVSALDALEALTDGVNMLREHMPETARIHYVVTDGGEAPNVVPSKASAWFFTRGKDRGEQVACSTQLSASPGRPGLLESRAAQARIGSSRVAASKRTKRASQGAMTPSWSQLSRRCAPRGLASSLSSWQPWSHCSSPRRRVEQRPPTPRPLSITMSSCP